MQLRARRDWNEAEIVKALRKAGALVWRLNGPGIPDLLVSFRGKWSVLEVKKPKGKLTDAQCNTRALAYFPVVETAEQALQAIGVQG
jgi:hypothetical protein